MNWSNLDRIRGSVERYYLRNAANNNINIPMYDQFVTSIRGDYEKAGFNLADEADLYKLWGNLALVCEATAQLLSECRSREELSGALRVMGTYGNMTGLFLRECTKWVPAIPAATTLEADDDGS